MHTIWEFDEVDHYYMDVWNRDGLFGADLLDERGYVVYGMGTTNPDDRCEWVNCVTYASDAQTLGYCWKLVAKF